ncbi:MAG: hypothetical protein M3N43_14825 [Actinomycetota bacterium]|nr:hypothetical protein [Actinomycetota bacterium]
MNRPAWSLALLWLAACGAGAATPIDEARPVGSPRSVAVAYGVGGPWRYHYVRADTIITTLPNGSLQQQVLERRLVLRWQVTAANDGLMLAVTIDSAQVYGLSDGAGRTMADQARGVVIRARLAPNGALSDVMSPSGNAIARTFAANLAWMVPSFPVEIREGMGWGDTLTSTVQFQVVDLVERTKRQSIGTRQGNAISVVMSGAVVRDGVTPQLRLDGSGTRSGTARVGALGRLEAGTGRDSVEMIASVQAIGQRVKILQVGAYTLTPIP